MPPLGSNNNVEVNISTNGDTKGVEEVQSSLESFGGNVVSFGKKLATMAEIATGAFAGIVSAADVMGLQTAADIQQATKAYETLLGSADKAKSAINDIKKDAARTPFDFTELIHANQMLISTGESVDDSRKAVLALGNAIVATGGGQAEFTRMIGNLQQIRNVGKATSMDIKQFGFAGINIYQVLSKATGKSVEQLKDMDISYDLLVGSLEKAAAQGGMFAGALENQGTSWNLLKSNLKDVINLMLSDVLMDTGVFDALNNGLNYLVNFLTEHKDQVVGFFKDTATVIKGFIGLINGEDYTPEIFAVLSKFVSANTAGKLTRMLSNLADTLYNFGQWVMQNKDNIISFLEGVAIALGALAVVGAIAQLVALITMLANPITLLIIAVGLLYAAWQNNWGGIRDIVAGLISFFTNTLIPAIKNTWDWIGKQLNWLKDNWAFAIGYIIGFFATLPFKLPFYIAMAMQKIFDYLKTIDWGKVWQSITDTFRAAWNGLWDIAQALWKKIQGIDWGQLFKDASKGILNGLMGLLEGAIQGALSGVPGASKIKLPRFADGVTNFGGGLAIVGERGPEMVRLPRGSDVIPNHKLGGMTVNQTNHIYNQIDMDASLRELGWQLSL